MYFQRSSSVSGKQFQPYRENTNSMHSLLWRLMPQCTLIILAIWNPTDVFDVIPTGTRPPKVKSSQETVISAIKSFRKAKREILNQAPSMKRLNLNTPRISEGNGKQLFALNVTANFTTKERRANLHKQFCNTIVIIVRWEFSWQEVLAILEKGYCSNCRRLVMRWSVLSETWNDTYLQTRKKKNWKAMK